MTVYLDLVMGLNFVVDFLLLLGTNRLSGSPPGAARAALAAAVGGLYGGMCLLPGFAFLAGLPWNLVSLGCMGVLAFGLCREAAAKTAVFVILSMALGGIAMGLGKGSLLSPVLGAAGLLLLCRTGLPGLGGPKYLPLELRHRGRQVRLLALRDTGNTLRDPVSGEPVTVVGPRTAQALTGLTREQLQNPVETLASGKVPGLRLIPYKSVGTSGGLMLALRLEEVKINARHAGTLVAFAPEGLEDGCQALVGAMG